MALGLELLVGPCACTMEFIKHESLGTPGLGGFVVVALVEAGAVVDVFNGKESIGSWAMETSLRWLKLESAGSLTVHIEWEVTFLVAWVVVEED